MKKLEDLEIYKLSMEIGDEIWKLSTGLDKFSQNTLGYQITRSADSIALNIAEGYGRFHFKENKNFCFYARGSLMETKSCLFKMSNRKLIDQTKFHDLNKKLALLHIRLNAYIKSIGKTK